MSCHELKCWPEYFQAILDGKKNFELRYDDRGFAVGDTLRLREWDCKQERYTGREIEKKITYLLKEAFSIPEHIVVMGLDLDTLIAQAEERAWNAARKGLTSVIGSLAEYDWIDQWREQRNKEKGK